MQLNFLKLSISITKYQEEFHEKSQKYVDFKPSVTNTRHVEGFRKMLNVELCVNCSELH